MAMTLVEAEELAEELYKLVDQLGNLSASLKRGDMNVLEEMASVGEKVTDKANDLYDFTHQ